MKRINDRLTVYTCAELHKIVSDLIDEDAFSYLTYANGFDDNDENVIIFAQYFPPEKKTMIIYNIRNKHLKKKQLIKYVFMEVKLEFGRSISHRCFAKDDYCDDFLKESEKFLRYKGNEAFTYVSDFIINDSYLTVPFLACNPDKFRPNDLTITPQYIIDAREHLFDN